MRKVMFAACMVLLVIVSSLSLANDPPHNEDSGVDCGACHGEVLFHTDPGSMTPEQLKDAYNTMCKRCHTSAAGSYHATSAPAAEGHSSAVIQGNYTFSTSCIDCHHPHYQDQFWHGRKYYGTEFRLFSGTAISAVPDNDPVRPRTVVTFTPASLIPKAGSEWDTTGPPDNNVEVGLAKLAEKTSAGRGTMFLPNTGSPYNSKIIESIDITANTITVKGTVNSVSTAGFAIAYGQSIKREIPYLIDDSTPVAEPVIFLDKKGERSFAHNDTPGGDDTTSNGICQVCHTQTSHWRNDGTVSIDGTHKTYSGTNCIVCHKHTDGFKASCDVCHGFPPGALVSIPATTGSVTTGVHVEHTDNQGYLCGVCHYDSVGSGPTHNDGVSQAITMGFVLPDAIPQGGEYKGQPGVDYDATLTSPITKVDLNDGSKTCADLYCHGNYDGSGLHAVPVWDDAATGDCGTCHKASNTDFPASGSHERHAGDGTQQYITPYTMGNKDYACTLCHEGIVGGTGPSDYTITDTSKHVSGAVDWKFDASDSRLAIGTPEYSIATATAGPSGGDTGVGHRAYGTCTVYCHSNIQPDGGIGAPDSYEALDDATPRKWGEVAGCYGCHTDYASYSNKTNTGQAEERHERMYSGSHTIHINGTGDASNPMDCLACHNWSGTATGRGSGCKSNLCHAEPNVMDLHVNGVVDVVFGTSIKGTYNDPDTNLPGDGYNDCSNTFCHSDGTSIRTGIVTPNTSPVWRTDTGVRLPCDECHGNSTYADWRKGMPVYDNGSPKENSHVKHVIDEQMPCFNCHIQTTLDGESILNQASHAVGAYRVWAGIGDYQYANRDVRLFGYNMAGDMQSQPGGGYCNGVTCHGAPFTSGGDYTVDKWFTYWGEYVGCGDCHLSTKGTGTLGGGDVDSYTYGDGQHAWVDKDQWEYSGHGKTSGTYDISGRSAANFQGAANCVTFYDYFFDAIKFPSDETRCDPCLYCHDDSVAHDKNNNSTNFFRLANYNVFGNGWNDTCLVCHATGSNGYDPDGAGTMGLKDSAIKMSGSSVSHWGSKHSASHDGGSFCWDCHDPHGDRVAGDGNIYMIHEKVTVDKLDAIGKPNTAALPTGLPVFVDDQVGSDYATVDPGPYPGLCNVCHSTPGNGGPDHYTWQNGDGHEIAQKCTNCHNMHYGGDENLDTDGDTVNDINDNCPAVSNTLQENDDSDYWGNACDNCPDDADNDADSDTICAGTGFMDPPMTGDNDICPLDPNNDIDSDTLCAEVDNCPDDANADQADLDGDGIGDVCDPFCAGIPRTEWVKQSGSAGSDEGHGITLDGGGDIYLTGHTLGYISTEGDPDETSADIFIGKYDSGGTPQWIRQAGTSGWDSGNSIALDGAGNIYVTGDASGQLPGSDTVTYPTDIYAGGYDVFVTKYNTTGIRQWVRQMGTTGTDYAFEVAVDSAGNSYIAGHTAGTLPGANASAGSSDIFIAKYDTSGTTIWVKQFGTSGFDNYGSIALDPSESYFYVTGSTSSKFTASPDDNAGGTDIFVAKFDASDGNNLWVRQLGTSNTEVGRGVTADSNNVYITGYAGALLPGSTDTYEGGVYDAFVAKYDSNGNRIWVKMFGTNNIDISYDISLNSDGSNVYVAGKVQGLSMFDQQNSSNNVEEIFFARFYASNPNDPDHPISGKLIGTTSNDAAEDIVIDSNGASYVTGKAAALLPGADTAYGSNDAFIIKSSYCP